MARDFGKVRTAFWADDKVVAWPERLKFVALYLLTSPHTNAIGCFRVPAQYVAADTGLSPSDVTDALAELEREGFLARCPKTNYVFLRRYLEHNGIENAKVGTHCIRLAAALPLSLPFLKDFEAALQAALASIGTVWEGFRYPIDTLSEPYRTPEPEPEPEPDPEDSAASQRGAPPVQNSVSKPVSKIQKATRWPADAVVPDDWLEDGDAARAEAGLPSVDLRLEATRFANYWASKSGGSALKTDWQRTWINWALSEKNGTGNRSKTGASSAHSNFLAGAALAARARDD